MYQLVIVEDEPEIRKGLVEQFPWAELGFEVLGDFSCGAEAIDFLSRRSVDVVVTDVKMDSGSGLDLAKYLNDNGRLETVVFYSAYRDFDFARAGMSYGVKRYMTKDMGYRELIEAFRELKRGLDCEMALSTAPPAPSADTPVEPAGANPVIANTVRYLSRAYRTATLQSTAKVVKFNPYYLSNYIKEKTGENFRDILTRIRMEKAKELLRDPTYRIGEIGDLVGYRDVRNFARCFKSHVGKLPHEYRAKVEERPPRPSAAEAPADSERHPEER